MVTGSWLMAQGWLGARPGPRGRRRGSVGGLGGRAAAPGPAPGPQPSLSHDHEPLTTKHRLINELFDYVL